MVHCAPCTSGAILFGIVFAAIEAAAGWRRERVTTIAAPLAFRKAVQEPVDRQSRA